LASFRRQVERSQHFSLVRSVDDVAAAARAGKLAIAFDLEGAKPILSNLGMVQIYYDLGIRQMHFAYNRANEAAGGCYDPEAPLTPLGARLVAECQDVGIIVDCSHVNERSAMAIMEIANKPVVFSHSNVRALNPNLRNITDAMIDGCAEVGGVIGVNGMSNFHRDYRASVEGIVEQIDYVAQRVGPQHVGIGLDYVYNQEQDDLPEDADPAYWFPPDQGYDDNFYKGSVFVPPESLSDLGERLVSLGYSASDIAGIWGGNFLRVAQTCWKS
jgi:membrane dipeptidase